MRQTSTLPKKLDSCQVVTNHDDAKRSSSTYSTCSVCSVRHQHNQYNSYIDESTFKSVAKCMICMYQGMLSSLQTVYAGDG